MSKYGSLIRGRKDPTPQSEPARDDQVVNSAGGYVFALDPFQRLKRFLILGSEGPTYYASEKQLTKENLACIDECVKLDPSRAVALVREVSERGLAPKNDPAIVALAKLSVTPAFNDEALWAVCRIPTHLFQFCELVQKFRGWGRRVKRAVGRWYTHWPADKVAYEVVKYREREGWSHRDVLRLTHPKPPESHKTLFGWIARYGKDAQVPTGGYAPIEGYLAAQAAGADIPALIRHYRLTREMVPTEALTKPEVWEALLEEMPLTALVRNLGNLSKCGLLKPFSMAENTVATRLVDRERVHKARLHPIALLSALRTYGSGRGVRGSGEWRVCPKVVEALNDAFYLAFEAIQPSGKRFLLGLDVSGSMDSGEIAGVPGLTPREAVGAMAMATVRSEPMTYTLGFSNTGTRASRWGNMASGLTPIPLTKSQRLDDVCSLMRAIPMGGTDCALPMLHAIDEKLEVDTFVVYTDSETWAGNVHPFEALKRYRDKSGIDAKCVVVGMTSTNFSLADPSDHGSLDVLGFDSSAPAILSSFARGEL